MAIRALKPVRTGLTGGVITQLAASRTAFGAYVTRVASKTAKGAPLEDTEDGLGFALEDSGKHTYDGFYDTYDAMPIATSGIVNALVTTMANTSLVAGDYLDVIDITSGTSTSSLGILAESGSNAGETNVAATSVAQMMEDVALTSAVYNANFTTTAIGDTSITVTSGVPTTMGLHVGDYIMIVDVDGNTPQLNRVTSLTATTIGLLIPCTLVATGTTDLLYAVRQAKVKIL